MKDFRGIKVLQLVDSLNLGGTERMGVNIANSLKDAGADSHLVVSRKMGPLGDFIEDGVKTITLGKKNFYDYKAFLNLWKYVRTQKPEFIHAHTTSIYWAVLLKILYPKFKLIWHDHFGLSDQLEKYPRKEMVFISKWIDGIIVVNDKLKNWWWAKLKIQKDRILFIPNFPYIPTLDKRENARFTILNLANFRPQKDQLTLLEAIKILAQKGVSFHLLLVGQFVDKVWYERVKEKIKTLSLENEVEIVGPIENVNQILGMAHVGVLSSESEGLPISLLEYGLAALPVVCTDVGDCGKVISDRRYGWLVPPKNPMLLAAALEEIIRNYTDAQSKGKALKERISENYGPNQFLTRYRELFILLRADHINKTK